MHIKIQLRIEPALHYAIQAINKGGIVFFEERENTASVMQKKTKNVGNSYCFGLRNASFMSM